jgi:predicted nucleic acid-binding protein
VSKVFFDTNILVYQLDKRFPKKQAICRSLVMEAASRGEAVVSTQVLQEFYVVAASKLRVDPVLVKGILHRLENMEVVTVTTDLIDEAIDISMQDKVSFWDALIVAAAESAKCGVLFSEDFADGEILRGVKIKNPL